MNNDTGQPGIPANTLAKVTPRISAAYFVRESDADGFFGATRLHASFGTGFRAPDGFELAFTNNPALKPEESISYDAGVEQRMAQGRAILDVTYFYNKFTDQIVSTGNLPTNFDSENIGKSRAWGLETSIRIHPIRSLEFSGSYTWMNTRDSGAGRLHGTHRSLLRRRATASPPAQRGWIQRHVDEEAADAQHERDDSRRGSRCRTERWNFCLRVDKPHNPQAFSVPVSESRI